MQTRLAEMAKLKSLRFALAIIIMVTIVFRLWTFAAIFSMESVSRHISTLTKVKELPKLPLSYVSPVTGSKHWKWSLEKYKIFPGAGQIPQRVFSDISKLPFTVTVSTLPDTAFLIAKNSSRELQSADQSMESTTDSRTVFEQKTRFSANNYDKTRVIISRMLTEDTSATDYKRGR